MQKIQATQNSNTITKRIGRTKFIVNVHFPQTSKETMNDKLLRLIKNDLLAEKL